MLEKLSVRLPNWLGDTVMAVPALRALRAELGNGRILLAGPWAPLLAGQQLADVLVAYPRSWGGRLRVSAELRRFDPDAALLLPNSLEAALAAVGWGARRRIGYAWGGRAWLLTDAVEPPRPRLHQVDEYARLVERLDIAVTEHAPRLTPPDASAPERARCRGLLEDAGVPRGAAGRPVVGVHLGAVFGSAKVWARERIEEFCRLLQDSGGTPILLGAPADAPLVALIAAEVRVASLVGRDSPELLPALLSEIDALVAGDTGVAHLAAALGTPVAALFGPTDPALSAPRGPVAVLAHPVPCSPCFFRTCPIEHPCMRLLAGETVREGIEALLGTRR